MPCFNRPEGKGKPISFEEALRPGEPTCWVSGVITVKDSGKLLAGVRVCAERVSEERILQLVAYSDGRGRYCLPIEIPGLRRLDLQGFGASLHHQVTLAHGETLIHDVEFAPIPSDPPYDFIEGEFAGEFTRGFEMKRFVPDSERAVDSTRQGLVARDAWVEFGAHGLDKHFIAGRYRVRWCGTLAGPGSFGHLGGSRYLMTVERVISQVRLDFWPSAKK